MYNDPITRQTIYYATPTSFDNNPQKVIALCLDTDEHYLLTPKFVLRVTPMMFQPKQVQSAINPITFTAQEAEIYSKAEITNFWNLVFFTKHSDTTLKLMGKAVSYDFSATSEQHQSDFYSISNRILLNPQNILRFRLHDHLLNTAPLSAPD